MRFHYRPVILALAAVLATGLLSACSAATPVGAQTSVAQSAELTAKVVSVDHANRHMTLRGTAGNEVTLAVSPEVRNFGQVMVGDTVRFTYQARIDFLVTGTAVPVTGVEVTVGGARAATGQMPSGILGTQTRLTLQVISVDPATHTVTFRRPDGSIGSITVENPKNFAFADGLRPGTNVMVTVTEAVAASIDRV